MYFKPIILLLLLPIQLFSYNQTWLSITEDLLHQFSTVSHFKYSYQIQKNPSFNSLSYTDHKDGAAKIIIYSGLLDELENAASNCYSKTKCMKKLLAPVLAHELAHYFQNDISNSKKIYLKKNKQKSKKLFQKMELHSDIYAVELLIRSGLAEDNSVMVNFLRIAVEWQRKNIENKKDPYTSSHPSLNYRLLVLGEENFRLPYQLDIAFSTIRNSHDTNQIYSACNSIDLALVRFPNNTELIRSMAVCKHKLWLSTAAPECIRMAHFIDSPIFSDDPEFVTKKIEGCGDKNFYIGANNFYQKAINTLKHDRKLLENYEMLLLYSSKFDLSIPKKNTSILQKVYDRIESVFFKDSLINYGVVQYFRGNTKTAKTIFKKKAGNIINIKNSFNIKSFYTVSSNNTEESSIQCVSSINYVLLKIYEKELIEKNTAKSYISALEQCSPQWSDYAKTLVR